MDQVRALRSVIPRKEGKQFFPKGPCNSGGIEIREGRSPHLSKKLWLERSNIHQERVLISAGAEALSQELILNVPFQRNLILTLSNCLASMGIVPMQVQHSLAGRLECFAKNWELITRDRWVLDTIQGYHIELMSEPYQHSRPHPPHYNQEQTSLIVEEIGDLLQKGAISEVPHPQGGFYSTLFLVPKKDGGQRPVINLKALNQFVHPHHFKMEGVNAMKDLMKQNDWLAKVDLKDAYFTIPIHHTQRKYLRFVFQQKTYQFNCLPFGLSSAPWVFIKTLKPAAALLRELGVRMVVYIDNILILAESRELAQQQASGLTYLLQCLGFVVNDKKSILKPLQSEARKLAREE